MDTKKTFWQPITYRYGKFQAVFRPKSPILGNRWSHSDSGKEREEFIKQQNEMVKKFANEAEYLDYYDLVKTLED